tara:strand:- start:208 stop:543 length:336 start_codon:yes stop_codon:yes gene_type:complete
MKPFHLTAHGGSIHCLEGISGRIFRACSANQCAYTGNLHSAKSYLDSLEKNTYKSLPSAEKREHIPAQRKTTLKWNADGNLSSVDMARILNRLEKDSLTECELSCEWGISS